MSICLVFPHKNSWPGCQQGKVPKRQVKVGDTSSYFFPVYENDNNVTDTEAHDRHVTRKYQSHDAPICLFVSCRRKQEILKDNFVDLLTNTIMLSFFQRILDWFKSLFWKEEMELTLVGLQYSGKTTFVNVIAVSFHFIFKECKYSAGQGWSYDSLLL